MGKDNEAKFTVVGKSVDWNPISKGKCAGQYDVLTVSITIRNNTGISQTIPTLQAEYVLYGDREGAAPRTCSFDFGPAPTMKKAVSEEVCLSRKLKRIDFLRCGGEELHQSLIRRRGGFGWKLTRT